MATILRHVSALNPSNLNSATRPRQNMNTRWRCPLAPWTRGRCGAYLAAVRVNVTDAPGHNITIKHIKRHTLTQGAVIVIMHSGGLVQSVNQVHLLLDSGII